MQESSKWTNIYVWTKLNRKKHLCLSRKKADVEVLDAMERENVAGSYVGGDILQSGDVSVENVYRDNVGIPEFMI